MNDSDHSEKPFVDGNEILGSQNSSSKPCIANNARVSSVEQTAQQTIIEKNNTGIIDIVHSIAAKMAPEYRETPKNRVKPTSVKDESSITILPTGTTAEIADTELNKMREMLGCKKPTANENKKQPQDHKSNLQQHKHSLSLKLREDNSNKRQQVINRVFVHWQKTFQEPQAKLDSDRFFWIERALKKGFSIEQLVQAIDGCAKTPFNVGQNKQGQCYYGLHTIFKNAEHIERFMRQAKNPASQNNFMALQQGISLDNMQAARTFIKEVSEHADSCSAQDYYEATRGQ